MVKYLLKCYAINGQEVISQELICNNFKEAILIANDIKKKINIHIKKVELIPN